MKDIKFSNKMLWDGKNARLIYIDWASLQPAEKIFSEEETFAVRSQIIETRERGMEPILVLCNFNHPQWFEKSGGWLSKNSLNKFESYAKYCSLNFGDFARIWLTFEGPTSFALLAYWQQHLYPYKKNIFLFCKSLFYIYRAHKKTFSIIKKNNTLSHVGLAHDTKAFIPARDNFKDKATAGFLNFFINGLFLKIISGFCDFVALIYHGAERVKFSFPPKSFLPTGSIYGLEVLLNQMRDVNKPLFIINNSKEHHLHHLLIIHAAIANGIQIGAGFNYQSEYIEKALLPIEKIEKSTNLFLHLEYYSRRVTKLKPDRHLDSGSRPE